MDTIDEIGREKKLAILVGGGPAPGINSVISSVVIEAIDKGFQVIGFFEGYKNLANGQMGPHQILTVNDISRITTTGGSFLKTSRVNPTKKVEYLENVVRVFRVLGITHLVSIGGDDTAFSTMKVAEHAEKQGYPLRSVHVPKTIDNDLPLPEGIPTFGFETARSVGTELVTTLAEDARTIGRWFVVVCMGRKAGHLALGIGKSAAATLTLIPEEFDMQCGVRLLVDTVVGAMFKRMSLGKNYGLALIAEGFMEIPNFFEGIFHMDEVPRDDHGHPMLAEVDFGNLLKREVQDRLKQFGYDIRVVSKDIGYELRCAPPVAYDVEYTRNLGYSAVDFLVNGGTQALVSIQHDRFVPIPFNTLFDPTSAKVKVRVVNKDSVFYRIAREYMIRLEPEDFLDSSKLKRLAVTAGITPERFKEEFYYVVEREMHDKGLVEAAPEA